MLAHRAMAVISLVFLALRKQMTTVFSLKAERRLEGSEEKNSTKVGLGDFWGGPPLLEAVRPCVFLEGRK